MGMVLLPSSFYGNLWGNLEFVLEALIRPSRWALPLGQE